MFVTVEIVNAFVDGAEGGNPAGVVLAAEHLSPAQKQAVAKAVGLSETAFISPSQSAAFKLEFFTPTRQIPHCGHATVATFALLRQINRIAEGVTAKETIDGNRAIVIDQTMAFMEQRAPQYQDLSTALIAEVLASLKITADQLIPGLVPTVVNTGIAFLIVPLQEQATLGTLRPNFEAIEDISEQLDLVGFYVFASQTKIPGRDAGSRMFAPRYGISEESATGMAAGPLACFLYDKVGRKKDQFLIEQGHWMNPAAPSLITVKLTISEGTIQRLMAGGEAKRVKSLDILI